MHRIGQVTAKLGISADTLRYYEKLGLLPRIERNASGLRLYGDKDLSRLAFIRRAQKMGFALDEIRQLLRFRENPHGAKPRVHELAREKLKAVTDRLEDLTLLRRELTLLVNLCSSDPDSCPILETLDEAPGAAKARPSRPTGSRRGRPTTLDLERSPGRKVIRAVSLDRKRR